MIMRIRPSIVLAAAMAAIVIGGSLPVPSARADAAEQQPQLAFLSGDVGAEDEWALHLSNADGTGLIELSAGGVAAWAWSPAGDRIAFVSERDGTMRLYLVDIGAAPQPIAAPVARATPAWSPDGASIAYEAADGDVWVIDATTSMKRNVSQDAAGSSAPIWSPSGAWLAYRSGGSLFVAGVGDDPPVRLSDDYIGVASWSVRSQLVFVADAAGDTDVMVAAPPVFEANPLTTSPADDRDPTWSPSGDRIVFVSDGDGDGPGTETVIEVIHADGSNRISLLPGSRATWSPVGSLLAVEDGATAYAVAPDEAGSAVVLGTENTDATLLWSPRGDRVSMHESGNFGFPAVRIVDREGTWVTTVHRANPGTVAWSLDGSLIAYQEVTSLGPSDLYVVPSDGGSPDRIGGSLPGPFAFDARWRPQPASDSVGLVDPGTGAWHLRDETGTVRSFYYGDPGDVPFMGDWDCDGVDTPGLYRPSDGYVYLRNSNTQGVADIGFYFGNPGDVPLAGDFDADRCDTVSIYRPSEQRFYVIDRLGSGDTGLGAASFSFSFGDPGDVPVVGDWDGDGISEVGLHRPGTGYFYWRTTLTTGIGDGSVFFGDPGDRFVAGDWIDNDGRDTPAVYRPSTTTFYLRATLTQGIADEQFSFGEGHWRPVAGRIGP